MALASLNYLKGAVFGFAAVSIWASWSVVTRLAVTTGLDASDIAALRFGVAGLLLPPVLLQRGLARDRLGWLGLAVIIAGTGAPYELVAAVGLRFAPAYDGGALNPGCMPLFVAVISALVLGEKHSTARKLGLSLILAGILIIVGWQAAIWSPSRTFGDALFLFAAFLTACFTVSHAAGGTRSTSRGSSCLHRIAGDLPSDLPRMLRNPPCANVARGDCGSGDFPGRTRHHCLPSSVRPCGCHPRRFRWRRLWSLGAGAVGTVCDTTPW